MGIEHASVEFKGCRFTFKSSIDVLQSSQNTFLIVYLSLFR